MTRGCHLLKVSHSEAEVGEHLFHGDAALLVERIEARLNGGAVGRSQLFVIVLIVDHYFQQRPHGSQFGGRKQIKQRMRLLAFLLQIESHGLLPFPVGNSLPAACFVLQDHTLQQAANHAFFLFIKAADGFELQPEVVIGAALILAEKEHIRTDL